MVFANGGLIVSQAPHILFIKDTNGDGVADQQKVLITGLELAIRMQDRLICIMDLTTGFGVA